VSVVDLARVVEGPRYCVFHVGLARAEVLVPPRHVGQHEVGDACMGGREEGGRIRYGLGRLI